jgi:hypothetical protein
MRSLGYRWPGLSRFSSHMLHLASRNSLFRVLQRVPALAQETHKNLLFAVSELDLAALGTSNTVQRDASRGPEINLPQPAKQAHSLQIGHDG